eukprot:GHRR01001575.1.p1 GENE.GHRR01001575.1~~GHRR01001575.1.p1  ORF type:complete len:213 (+),score=26.78 GHRR01001575.1:160-798(+)
MTLRLLGRTGSRALTSLCELEANILNRACSRTVVTAYAISPTPDSLASQVFEEDEHCKTSSSRSLRNSTAAVARRLQWNTVPLTDAPKSLEAVMADPATPQARIITEAQWPYRVVYANHAWEQLCGWSVDEAIGKPGLSFMQGKATNQLVIAEINSAVKEGQRIDVHVVNYKKDGTPFLNHLRVTPLRSGRLGEYRHMLGILSEVFQTQNGA